jgi:hypothetical protein
MYLTTKMIECISKLYNKNITDINKGFKWIAASADWGVFLCSKEQI